VSVRYRSASFVARMRARQEELFTEQVSFTRGSGEGTVDDAGEWEPSAATTVYVGPALVRRASTDRRESDAEFGSVGDAPYTVKVPANTDVQPGDVVTVLASRHDDALVGSTLWAAAVPLDGLQIARVVRCTDQPPTGVPR
jgi:hypothetical protein